MTKEFKIAIYSALIGAVATIIAAIIPLYLKRNDSENKIENIVAADPNSKFSKNDTTAKEDIPLDTIRNRKTDSSKVKQGKRLVRKPDYGTNVYESRIPIQASDKKEHKG